MIIESRRGAAVCGMSEPARVNARPLVYHRFLSFTILYGVPAFVWYPTVTTTTSTSPPVPDTPRQNLLQVEMPLVCISSRSSCLGEETSTQNQF